jgi:hypothetical protein
MPEILASRENSGEYLKYWRMPEILVSHENSDGCLKYWLMPEILVHHENLGSWQKYRHTIGPWRALKSPRLAKMPAEKFGVFLLFGLGGISSWGLLTFSWSG